MNEEASEVTLLVAVAFDQLGVRYLIGGSMTSAVHGVPRATLDADLLCLDYPQK